MPLLQHPTFVAAFARLLRLFVGGPRCLGATHPLKSDQSLHVRSAFWKTCRWLRGLGIPAVLCRRVCLDGSSAISFMYNLFDAMQSLPGPVEYTLALKCFLKSCTPSVSCYFVIRTTLQFSNRLLSSHYRGDHCSAAIFCPFRTLLTIS